SGGMLGPLHGGGPIPSMPPTSRAPPPRMTIRHTGAGRPAGHQFVHRIRTEAARARASVTIGQPRGVGELLANHCGEVPWMSTPEIGLRFASKSVITGVPRSVHVSPARFVTVMVPIKDPAAPWN